MILGTVLDELERTNKSTALVTLCIGGGMGTATIIERVYERVGWAKRSVPTITHSAGNGGYACGLPTLRDHNQPPRLTSAAGIEGAPTWPSRISS